MRLSSPCLRLVVFFCLACGFQQVSALQVQGLYEAEVPVPSKAETERNLALGAALRNVLVKVTGERNPQSYPGIVQAMSHPGELVEQFRYRSTASDSSDTATDDEGGLKLWARFDSQVVDRLVRDAGLPSWGKNRPSMLMWLAVEDQSGRSLIGADDSPTITNVLHAAAGNRGVPFVVPLMDLVDRSVVSVSDVWAGFPDRILQASSRYRADIVLLSRVHQPNTTQWEARWRLFVDGAPHDWTLRNNALDVMLVRGVNHAADIVAARFTQSASGAGDSAVDLAINDIRTLGDYARTLSYLKSLDGISRIDVKGASGNQVSFSLAIRGGASAFSQVIGLGRTLTPTSADGGLQFRLLP